MGLIRSFEESTVRSRWLFPEFIIFGCLDRCDSFHPNCFAESLSFIFEFTNSMAVSTYFVNLEVYDFSILKLYYLSDYPTSWRKEAKVWNAQSKVQCQIY